MYYPAKEFDVDILMFEHVNLTLLEDKTDEQLGLLLIQNLKKMEFFDYKDNNFLSLIFGPGVFPVWNKLLKTDFLKKNHLYFNEDLIWFDDLEIYYRQIFHATKMKTISERLYCWNRIVNKSLTETHFNLSDLTAYKIIRDLIIKFGVYEKVKIEFIGNKLDMYEWLLNKISQKDLEEYKKLVKIDLEEDNLSQEEIAALHPWEKNTLKFFI